MNVIHVRWHLFWDGDGNKEGELRKWFGITNDTMEKYLISITTCDTSTNDWSNWY